MECLSHSSAGMEPNAIGYCGGVHPYRDVSRLRTAGQPLFTPWRFELAHASLLMMTQTNTNTRWSHVLDEGPMGYMIGNTTKGTPPRYRRATTRSCNGGRLATDVAEQSASGAVRAGEARREARLRTFVAPAPLPVDVVQVILCALCALWYLCPLQHQWLLQFAKSSAPLANRYTIHPRLCSLQATLSLPISPTNQRRAL